MREGRRNVSFPHEAIQGFSFFSAQADAFPHVTHNVPIMKMTVYRQGFGNDYVLNPDHAGGYLPQQ